MVLLAAGACSTVDCWPKHAELNLSGEAERRRRRARCPRGTGADAERPTDRVVVRDAARGHASILAAGRKGFAEGAPEGRQRGPAGWMRFVRGALATRCIVQID